MIRKREFLIKCNLGVFVKFDTDKFLGEKKRNLIIKSDVTETPVEERKQIDKSLEGLCTVCFTFVLKFLFLIGNDQ